MKKKKDKSRNRSKRLTEKSKHKKAKQALKKLQKDKALKKLCLPEVAKQLFNPVVGDTNLSQDFKSLLLAGYKPAVAMMEKCFDEYEDKDGNFIEQFQTTGFDARTWELYLNTYFLKSGFEISSAHSSPDYILSKDGKTVCVEAVTTNRSLSGKLENVKNYNSIKEHYDFTAIKMGSSLWSKHQKEYWNLGQVSDQPLVFAIECFHQKGPFYSGDAPLIDYLYGKNFSWFFDEENNLVIKEHENTTHIIGEKEIPSGFFNLPASDNISAVLFSNSGTAAKFNRMGKIKWPKCNIQMIREGMSYKHDPNSDTPDYFKYEVGSERPKEQWGEGLIMFHNPNAKHKVDKSLFPDIPHGDYENDKFVVENMPDFHPIWSITKIRVG